MAVFWILAALMTAVAVAFVLVPMLRARKEALLSPEEANLGVLRGQRRELDADVANGTLPADARDEALAELVARAERDLGAAGSTPAAAASPMRPWPIMAASGIAVPVLAFGIYLAVGAPDALDPKRAAAPAGNHPVTDAQIVAMVESLATKVRDRPDDVQGWSLLARSMGALGRFKESAEAYEHLLKIAPADAQILADYADALGMAQGRSLAGKPLELVKKALAMDPNHPKALAMAGTAAMDAGDFDASLRYYRTLATVVPPGSEDAAQVSAVIEDVRARALAAGKKVSDEPPQVAKAAASGEAKTVTGSVSVAPAIAGKVSQSDTLFIFARADGGPRVPLAVMRSTAQKLPLAFVLDDSSSMSPELRLSTASALRIEARISRTGNATPQPGDLIGLSAVVKPGARDVKIVVDREVPST